MLESEGIDRGEVRMLAGGENAKRRVLEGGTLDFARRELTNAIPVQQQGSHHSGPIEGHLVYFVLELVRELDVSAIEDAIQSKDASGARPCVPEWP